MVNLFAVLFLLSLLILPIALVKPSLIFRNGNINRKQTVSILGGLIILFFILIGFTAPRGEMKGISTIVTPTIIIPTLITPTSSSILLQPTIVPSDIPSPTPTITPAHNGVFVKVVNVIDGDTIKIETGETVRYIGIDSPETVHPNKPIQCYGKEASDKNTEFVEGKVVILEKDISNTDKYGRLLRYIWLDDVLINEVLVREGYAQSSTYPPDVKYQNRFIEAQRLAREEEKGLWGSACTITPNPPHSTVKPQSPSVQSNTSSNVAGSVNNGSGIITNTSTGAFVCNCSKTCPQISSCAEAQYQLNVCGCTRRDADGDGIACDADCQ